MAPQLLNTNQLISWGKSAKKRSDMKRILSLSLFVLSSILCLAQGHYSVNVYSNKYENMGVKYQPIEVQSNTSNSSDYVNRVMQETRDYERRLDNDIRAAQQRAAEGKSVVSDNISTSIATNLSTKLQSTIRIRTIRRKNGTMDLSCLGIKKGETWQPCDKPIISLQQMYQSATTESEKSSILGLMDYGNYLLDTGKDIYIIK